MAHDVLRALPSVSRLLEHPRTERLLARFNRDVVVEHCRAILEDLRTSIVNGGPASPVTVDVDALVDRLESRIETDDPRGLQRVVNATGTILHTNLGRALLARPAVDALVTAATQPVSLEYDLATGNRGRREHTIEDLLVSLTGAEAATVVNNNAAAVLLALNTLASGKEVIVSRGELIEIGGAFRIPDIMAKSGVFLREVGTTNRTHPSDYESAISDRTGLILKVHTSNYRIVGFVSEVGLADLVAIGAKHRIPVMEDLGSGALVDLTRYGLPREPVVSERVRLGADLVTFSGDKVLGGPQSGMIAGKSDPVTQTMRNPLHRALRCDKLTIAALEATLRLYRNSTDLARDIPALRAFTRSLEEVETTARRGVTLMQEALGPEFCLSVQPSTAQIGSGALPTEEIPTMVIAVQHGQMSAAALAERFRQAQPPIIGRISDDCFLLDVRTVFEPEDLVPHWPQP